METKQSETPTKILLEWFESLTTNELIKYFPNRNPSAVSLKEIRTAFDSLDRIAIHIQFHEGKKIKSEATSIDNSVKSLIHENTFKPKKEEKVQDLETTRIVSIRNTVNNISDRERIFMFRELIKFKNIRMEIIKIINNVVYKGVSDDTEL